MRIEVTSKQLAFIRSSAHDCLTFGGRGSGKTTALAFKTAKRAAVKGAREGLTRFHQSALEQTTLKTLLEGDGKMPAVLPLGTYTHDRAKRTIRIHGGGEIVYFSAKDFRKLGSYNLSGLAIEELVELSLQAYEMLQGCVRVDIEGLPNQINAACNPSVPSHWVAKAWGLSLDNKPKTGHASIFANPRDNPYLPPSFIAVLEEMSGVARARFLEGKWVGSEGLVYDRWDRNIHVQEREEPKGGWARVIVGVDEGYSNPFAALRICMDGDGRMHVEREFYRPGQLQKAKVAAVRSFLPFETAVVDPSAADLIAEFLNGGLSVVEADNAVFDGIVRVQGRLEVPGDGLPRLTVDPRCENVMREFESYEWRVLPTGAVKDEPKKEHDHAMDALRYAVSRVDSGPRVVGSWNQGDKPPQTEHEDLHAHYDKLREDEEFGWDNEP